MGECNSILDLPSKEEMLLRKLQAQLRVYQNMERPLKASEMTTEISVDELAEIMAWAQVALRDFIITKKHYIENLATYLHPTPPIATDAEKD